MRDLAFFTLLSVSLVASTALALAQVSSSSSLTVQHPLFGQSWGALSAEKYIPLSGVDESGDPARVANPIPSTGILHSLRCAVAEGWQIHVVKNGAIDKRRVVPVLAGDSLAYKVTPPSEGGESHCSCVILFEPK